MPSKLQRQNTDYGWPNRTQRQLLETHLADAFRLPEPSETFRYNTMANELAGGMSLVKKFSEHAVIERAERVETGDGFYWRTNPDMYRWLVDRKTPPETTPCGCSTGTRTLTAGETYTCTNPECDIRFDYETALEVHNE